MNSRDGLSANRESPVSKWRITATSPRMTRRRSHRLPMTTIRQFRQIVLC
jgi:hypothetical protein